MKEKELVNLFVESLTNKGYVVATEVANLYRSADIAFIDDNDLVCIVECKISNMSQAIEQVKTHKIAADRVLIVTWHKKTRPDILTKIRNAGIGLIYINQDGSIEEAVKASESINPWPPSRDILKQRIREAFK
jgi:hypothetical protein